MQWLFALAALPIIAGIVGLLRHFQKPPTSHEDGGELHVYKGCDFEHNTPMLDHFAAMDAHLAESLKDRSDGVDWKAHEKWTAATIEQITKDDSLAAFRARCKAVHCFGAVQQRSLEG